MQSRSVACKCWSSRLEHDDDVEVAGRHDKPKSSDTPSDHKRIVTAAKAGAPKVVATAKVMNAKSSFFIVFLPDVLPIKSDAAHIKRTGSTFCSLAAGLPSPDSGSPLRSRAPR